MKPGEAQEVVSAGTAEPGESDDFKLVPVSESIRYRRRAQSAEKKIEALAEQLAEAKAEAITTAKQLSRIQAEQELVRKLAAAGTVDLEATLLIAKARLEGEAEADVDSVIKQLKKEKQHLFAGSGGAVTAKKTAGARERGESNQTILERAAKKAATTGNRGDLEEYLKLRRNFL